MSASRALIAVAIATAVLLVLTASAATAAVALGQEPSAPLVGTTLNNTFAPEAVTITEGQSVSFANLPVPTLPGGDRFGPHSLVINGEQVEPTATFWLHSHTFQTAGTFTFYCSLHGSPTDGMRGFVIVRPAEPPPAADRRRKGTTSLQRFPQATSDRRRSGLLDVGTRAVRPDRSPPDRLPRGPLVGLDHHDAPRRRR